MALAQDSSTAGQIFFGPVEQHLGGWATGLFEFLLMTGSYACGMAFHNCASRYLYAIGREDASSFLGRTLGATHPRHGSPYIAGFVQSAIATAIVVWFFLTGRDPYGQLYVLMALLGTTAILIVQALAAFACIAYFHLHGRRNRDAHWFRTLVAPLIGGLGMLYVIWLLVQNVGFAAGAAASDIVFQLSPWIVGLAGLGGVVFALAMRRFAPQRYELLGRVVLDVRERRESDADGCRRSRSRSGGRAVGISSMAAPAVDRGSTAGALAEQPRASGPVSCRRGWASGQPGVPSPASAGQCAASSQLRP